ncbi:MAG: nucleotidyltransferase domain-containing protein [Candidatus Bipolaricaulota bacterium]|nr:nucleotidyltransferase domain-containing protein [Candidatus Bipolaricaulota bacterium]
MAGTWAERRERYARRLDRALELAVSRLASLPEVERVILFGSYARGRRDLATDLDLLVVMRTEEGFLDRLGRLYGLLAGIGVDLDLLAYTPREIEENRDRPFFRRALAGGRVVYEKRG